MKKKTIIILFLLGFIATSFSSNPVTLVEFHNTFNYLEEVQYVTEHGQIDGRIVTFLVDQNNPIDEKAGIINALTANNSSGSNALGFRQFIARKYKENWKNLTLDKLTADELFCLGYLTILDEKGNIANGLPMLELAEQKNPSSYTISLFRALASAEQSINSGNECEGWKTCNAVKSNASLNNDLDTGVANLIFDTMESFNNGCE